MEKKNFITLVLGVIGALLFSIGMCMALLEEWAMFHEGVIVGAIGAVLLLITWIVYRKMSGYNVLQYKRQVFYFTTLYLSANSSDTSSFAFLSISAVYSSDTFIVRIRSYSFSILS